MRFLPSFLQLRSCKSIFFAALYSGATTRFERFRLFIWCWWKDRPYPYLRGGIK